jgi:hypothetical protein
MGRQPGRRVSGQDAEQGTARRNPGKGALEDPNAEAVGEQVADGERGQSPVGA